MPKWKRILIWAGIVVLVGGVYLWFFGVQTTSTLMVRYQFRKLITDHQCAGGLDTDGPLSVPKTA